MCVNIVGTRARCATQELVVMDLQRGQGHGCLPVVPGAFEGALSKVPNEARFERFEWVRLVTRSRGHSIGWRGPLQHPQSVQFRWQSHWILCCQGHDG